MEPSSHQRAGQDKWNIASHSLDLCARHALGEAGRERKSSECSQARVACVTNGPTGGDGRGCSVGIHDVEGDQAPGGPGTGCRGQRAIHQGSGGNSGPSDRTGADPTIFSNSPAHCGDVGTLGDATPGIADDEEVVFSRSMAAHRSQTPSDPHRTVAADEGNPELACGQDT